MEQQLQPSEKDAEERLKEIEKWLSDFSKECYSTYAKFDSIYDRVRTLTPPLTVLGAGLIYETTKYHYRDSVVDTLFFYIPITVGLLSFVAALYIMLWALVGKSSVAVLAEADDVLKKIEDHKDKGLTASQIEKEITKNRCRSATENIRSLKARSKALTKGTKLSIVALTLLIVATPKFVHSILTLPSPEQHEQR